MAQLLGASDVEQGGYRNSFHAVAASTPLRPRFVRLGRKVDLVGVPILQTNWYEPKK